MFKVPTLCSSLHSEGLCLGNGIASENVCYLIAFLLEYLIVQYVGGINLVITVVSFLYLYCLTFILSFQSTLPISSQNAVLRTLWVPETFSEHPQSQSYFLTLLRHCLSFSLY